MVDNNFAFLVGLPRTGSTVLSTLLNQSPDLYATGTSLTHTHFRTIWTTLHSGFLAYDLRDPDSSAWGMMEGVLRGAHTRCPRGKMILEKNRQWVSEIPRLRRILGTNPRMIATVRPVSEILSSFVLLSKKIGTKNKIDDEVLSRNCDLTVANRTRVIWEKYIYPDWRVFKAGYEEYRECIHLLNYSDLILRPQETVDSLCEFLGVQPYKVKTSGLCTLNSENDAVYGLPGLHSIREELKRISPHPKHILGEEVYNFWTNKQLDFWSSNPDDCTVYLPPRTARGHSRAEK